MSTTLSTMIRLRGIQNKMKQLVESLDETTCRTQFHPQLSPIGWHLGHCLYTENYWLHEIIQDNNKYTKKQKKIFSDNGLPIHKRGSKLPKLKKLLIQAQQQQDTNDLLLIEMIPPLSNHPLFENEYIQNYIIQHYAQHFEVMQIIMNQSGLSKTDDNFIPATPLTPDPIIKTIEQLPHGEYKIGGETPFAYDNELPEHTVELDTCNISMQPVTNAEYLSFINDQGYQT
ncbi:MAG: DinB family protein, partial [Gammaproteobacteria bacterium]|nr:DinB family protein [Gammaproteobacteria bacterium]